MESLYILWIDFKKWKKNEKKITFWTKMYQPLGILLLFLGSRILKTFPILLESFGIFRFDFGGKKGTDPLESLYIS